MVIQKKGSQVIKNLLAFLKPIDRPFTKTNGQFQHPLLSRYHLSQNQTGHDRTTGVYAMTLISFNFSTMFALAFVALQVITMPDAVDGADSTCVSRRKQTRLTPHTAMTHT